ncbi:MAG: HIT domain-containing protein [Candidatus Eremiobacteraeota bacterium]|nr:HIT domain-containing protein [Candidatus Eremiobacteraeota bacterium]
MNAEATSDPNCVFCKIVAGAIPAQFVHREDEVIVINDVSAQAPVHLLAIPAEHYATPSAFTASADPGLIAKVFSLAAKYGRERCAGGFRIVVNEGSDGGQTVEHVHLHVLGGRRMNWPPG